MSTAIIWFRRSLRLHDNEALSWACNSDDIDRILPIYIMDFEDLFDQNNDISYNRIRFLQESLEDYISKPYVIINPYIIETCALI